MAWIKVIDESEATDALRKAFKQVTGSCKRVANILKVHSVHPEALSTHLALYLELMFAKSELTRAERELLAVAVSVANDCHY